MGWNPACNTDSCTTLQCQLLLSPLVFWPSDTMHQSKLLYKTSQRQHLPIRYTVKNLGVMHLRAPAVDDSLFKIFFFPLLVVEVFDMLHFI